MTPIEKVKWADRDIGEYQHAYYERNKVAILTRQRRTIKEYLQTDVGKRNKLASYYRMVAKYPDKYKARYLLKSAVKSGCVKKGVCEVCGATKVDSHHDDYTKPLDVRWLCRQHHHELEGRCTKKTS